MGLVNRNGPGPLLPARFGIIKLGIAERGQRGNQVTSQVLELGGDLDRPWTWASFDYGSSDEVADADCLPQH